MPFIPDKIKIDINVHFDRIIIEHLAENSAAIQKAIDDATKKIQDNTAQITEAQK